MGIHVPAWQPRGRTAPIEPTTQRYQVVVVGGGLSGVAAAVAAARRGARVALLEPTHLLGGQMSDHRTLALLDRAERPRPRFSTGATVIEVDLERQLVRAVARGRGRGGPARQHR